MYVHIHLSLNTPLYLHIAFQQINLFVLRCFPKKVQSSDADTKWILLDLFENGFVRKWICSKSACPVLTIFA
jgi:hypothetical protein